MATNTESTSSSLLRNVRNNDQQAWNRLAGIYAPLVYKWTRRVGLSQEDAADIGQEVFRVVAVKLSGFSAEDNGPGFRAWIWQITRNKIGDFIREMRHRETALGGSGSLIQDLARIDLPLELDAATDAEDRQDLFAAVLRLIQTDFEERTWKAFWRSTIEEQSTQRIAEELNMTVKAVRQSKYRVLKRLRDEFGDLLS